MSRGKAWEGVLQSFPEGFAKPHVETMAGELDKDAEALAWASAGSGSYPRDSPHT